MRFGRLTLVILICFVAIGQNPNLITNCLSAITSKSSQGSDFPLQHPQKPVLAEAEEEEVERKFSCFSDEAFCLFTVFSNVSLFSSFLGYPARSAHHTSPRDLLSALQRLRI
jgi:hypothetical protein